MTRAEMKEKLKQLEIKRMEMLKEHDSYETFEGACYDGSHLAIERDNDTNEGNTWFNTVNNSDGTGVDLNINELKRLADYCYKLIKHDNDLKNVEKSIENLEIDLLSYDNTFTGITGTSLYVESSHRYTNCMHFNVSAGDGAHLGVEETEKLAKDMLDWVASIKSSNKEVE